MEIVGAQATTENWLRQLGTPDADVDAQTGADLARKAFAGLTDTGAPQELTKASVVALRAPAAVQHLVGMLSAYDWAFVEQAQELRGYCVAKIVEETKNGDPKVRLKALDMLGKVTEVGLYTERIEVTHVSKNADELEESIRARLSKYLPQAAGEVQDVAPKRTPVLEVQDAKITEKSDGPDA